jgi:hypothetical protein
MEVLETTFQSVAQCYNLKIISYKQYLNYHE